MPNGVAGRFIGALHRLEDQDDVGAIAELFAEGADLRNPAHAPKERGQEGARRFWRAYRGTFREIHSEFRNVVETDRAALLEWRSRGRTAEGRPVDYEGVSVLEFEDGRIRSFRAYFDPTELGHQLGGRPRRA